MQFTVSCIQKCDCLPVAVKQPDLVVSCKWRPFPVVTQLTFTCSKSTIETLKKCKIC